MSTPGDGELEDRVRLLEREVARLRETRLEQGDQLRAVRGEMREGFATVNVGTTRMTELLRTAIGDDES